MKKTERYRNVLNWFEAKMPEVETELEFQTPFQLLIAVILSAQCTDKRVNLTTPALFAAYPTPEDLAEATPEDVYQHIKSISYPNNKAKHLVGMAKMLVDAFNSIVPDDTKQLQKMPGVGRKTANVIASVIYHQPTMAVDTHVFRVSNRIGLTTNSKNVLSTELELTKYIPSELIHKAHHWLILHGRYICVARNPKCSICGLTEWCRYYLGTVAKLPQKL